MKYICVTRCFYNNREWKLGEELTAPKGAKLPKHFKPEGKQADAALNQPEDPGFTALHDSVITQIQALASQADVNLDKFLKDHSIERLDLVPPDRAAQLINELQEIRRAKMSSRSVPGYDGEEESGEEKAEEEQEE